MTTYSLQFIAETKVNQIQYGILTITSILDHRDTGEAMKSQNATVQSSTEQLVEPVSAAKLMLGKLKIRKSLREEIT